MLRKLSSIAAVLVLPLSAQASSFFIDEDMSSGVNAFESFYLSFTDPGNLSFDVNGFDTGGNPADFLRVSHLHGALDCSEGYDNCGIDLDESGFDPSDGFGIQSFHRYLPLDWDPANDGQILNVSFSVDRKRGSGDSSGFGSVFFGVRQGTQGRFAGFQTPAGGDDWETISATGLTQSSFFDVVDFTGGGPISFGFGFLTRSSGADQNSFFAEELFAADFDNFRVQVTPVPLPAAGWLFLSALAGLGGLAWRRKQAAA